MREDEHPRPVLEDAHGLRYYIPKSDLWSEESIQRVLAMLEPIRNMLMARWSEGEAVEIEGLRELMQEPTVLSEEKPLIDDVRDLLMEKLQEAKAAVDHHAEWEAKHAKARIDADWARGALRKALVSLRTEPNQDED